MEPLSQAIAIVRRAENEIRTLLLRYAGEGAYEHVGLLADWAQQLRQLSEQSDSSNGMRRPSVDFNRPVGVDSANDSPVDSRLPIARTDSRKPLPKRKTLKTKPKKDGYPKFLRDRDELVKIGWSKKQKSEYRHKASKEVVIAVAQALQERGAKGERFTFEELLPFRDSRAQTELPSYQTYLSLAWLRNENLIVQHGRQGYSLRPDINLTDAIEERWKLLSKS